MLSLLAPLANASQHLDFAPAAAAHSTLARAGLIDLDATIISQGLFFAVLLLVLPSMVYKPLLARFDQREARTDGARAQAKALRRQADDEVTRYEAAVANQRRDALTERAETRSHTQQQADQMLETARAETVARINAGIAAQRQAADETRKALSQEAASLGTAIADKLVRG